MGCRDDDVRSRVAQAALRVMEMSSVPNQKVVGLTFSCVSEGDETSSMQGEFLGEQDLMRRKTELEGGGGSGGKAGQAGERGTEYMRG
jgi:hypothetical protein